MFEGILDEMDRFVELQQNVKVGKDKADSKNKYKYRNVSDIYLACKPILKKNRAIITLSDDITDIGGVPFIKATATYKDSDFTISSSSYVVIELQPKFMGIGQACGATASYARKYAIEGLLLIDNNPDLDDAGEDMHKDDKVRQNMENDFKLLAFKKETDTHLKAQKVFENIGKYTDNQVKDMIKKLEKL